MLIPSLLAAVACPIQDAGGLATDVAALPDGTLLVARRDGFIRVVHAASGSPVLERKPRSDIFAKHPTEVTHLAVDPTGELVAASSIDGRVALWPVERDAEGEIGFPGRYAEPRAVLHPTPEQWSGAAHIAWTHDGAHLLTWSSDELHGDSPTAVQLWTEVGELVWTGFHARWAAASPVDDWIAAVRRDEVFLMRPGVGETTLRIEGALDVVAFSPDGSRLAVGGGPACRLWIIDVATKEIVLEKAVDVRDWLQEHRYITRAHWSPNGEWVGITVGKGLIPAVVDPSDGEVVWTGGFHGGQMSRVFDLAWTPDDRIVFGLGETKCADPTSGKTVLLSDDEHTALVPIADGHSMVLVAGGWVQRHDLGTATPRWKK